MPSLLSETSSFQRHTELAAVIGETPVVGFEVLKYLANKSVAEYFATNEVMPNVRSKTELAISGILKATEVVHQSLDDDETDDNLYEQPDTSLYFPNLDLHLACGEHRETDGALQSIFGNIEAVSRFDDKETSAYLFRIATIDDSYNLIGELHRTEPDTRGIRMRLATVNYDIHFSGYEVA